jgi:Uma2 family endonuclease
MAIETNAQLVTVEEFEAFITLPENAERLFELINGEIVEKMVTQAHGVIIMNIGSEIRFYLKQNPIGRLGPEISHRAPNDAKNERLPDLSFVSGLSDAVVTRGSVMRMPDLAVEVKSHSNTYKELLDKAQYYLANGTRMVWLVYPEKRLVEALTPADRQLLDATETLSGGDVLPGFTMAVKDIFADI